MAPSSLPEILLQSNSGGGAAILIFFLLFLVIVGLMIAGMWKVFTKAGQPGWASLIPIYNFYILIKIAERPGWWIILAFIPVVSLIPALIVPYNVGQRFGKGLGFGLGLIFLPFIFYPLLGFSDATYTADQQPNATA